jgi:Protein of unknown function (DUF1549)/Protein of unknown function (DUF1553)
MVGGPTQTWCTMKTGYYHWFRCLSFALSIVAFLHFDFNAVLGQSSLTTTIDTLVERDFEPIIGRMESDGPLLRRLSLDIRLVVPTSQEVDEFLADGAPERWQRWVRRFLDDPLYRERMVDWLDKTLLQRRPHQQVDRAKWLAYLRKVVDEQKPIDQIAKETIAGVWWNQSERAQQRFFLERAGDSHAIARDIGRVFFGRDMQCAQCHDHPQVDDYLQVDYHGLLAFVTPSSFSEAKFKDDKGAEQKVQLYVERAARDAPFESVFDKGVLFRTGTRAPGSTESFDPFEAPDQRYQPTPMPESMEGAPNPPIFSRRNSLVSQLTASNRAFAENWSNRLWAMVMGQGLVHPLDMHHPGNPPSNPRLLDALTDELIRSGFSMRSMIEQIVLSDAYKVGAQMPIESSLRFGSVVILPGDLQSQFASTIEARKQANEAELVQLTTAADAAKKQYEDSESPWRASQKERVEVWAEIDKVEAIFKESMKKNDASKAAFAAAKKLLDDASAKQKLLEEAAGKLEQAKLLGPDDAELQQAIATAKTKAEASKASIPNLEKGLADATVPRDANQMALEAERTKVLELAAKLNAVEERLHAADVQFTTMRAQWQRAHRNATVMSNRIADLSRIQTWLASSHSVGDFENELALASQSLEQSKGKLTQQIAQMVVTQQQIADSTLAKNAVAAKQSKALEDRKSTVAQLEQLRSTFDSLDKSLPIVQSAQSLPAQASAAESLIAAKQTIQTSIDATKATVDGMTTSMVAIETELAEKSKLLETQVGQLAMEEQTRLTFSQSVEQCEKLVAEKADDKQKAIDACSLAMQSVLEVRQKSSHLAQNRPLSPEQLGWSILQSTDVLKNYVAAEVAELEKQSPLAADASPEVRSARALQATRQALDKLRPHVDTFATLYSSGVGQTSDEFFASPDQALFMANGGSVFQWSAPSSNNVANQIVQQPDGIVAAKLLFRSLFSREATAEEQSWIADKLSKAGDKKPAVAQELVWSLLTSSEYRVYP